MNISRTSWHYRAVREVYKPPFQPGDRDLYVEAGLDPDTMWEPVGSCAYFRALAVTAVLAIIMSPLLLLFGVLAFLFDACERFAARWPWTVNREKKDEKRKRALQKKALKREALVAAYRHGRRHKLCERIDYTG